MAGKPLIAQFQDSVEDSVVKYLDSGLTIGEVIGTLEVVKLNLWRQNCEEEEGFGESGNTEI